MEIIIPHFSHAKPWIFSQKDHNLISWGINRVKLCKATHFAIYTTMNENKYEFSWEIFQVVKCLWKYFVRIVSCLCNSAAMLKFFSPPFMLLFILAGDNIYMTIDLRFLNAFKYKFWILFSITFLET